ncbi:MAG: transferrin-binding protein-like solute binding protein [Cytophagales bacterium]|nr:transferrin-binding protein-like solute binding protein [Cytophagales bacterium]
MNKISFIFLVLLAIWSCSEDDEAVTDNTSNDENAQRTFAEAQTQYEALRENAKHSLTRKAGFPTSGTMVYKGMHMGEFFERNTTSGFKLDYFADVEFTLDFEAQTFTGQLINFTTNLEGFDNPEGSLNVSGSIRGPAELGDDAFGLRFRVQDGDLKQEGRTANFDAFTENKGRFLGESGQSVNIRITSIFRWTEGPDTGTTSETIGFMHADRE